MTTGAAVSAHAESKLLLPYPAAFGVIPAVAYDLEGKHFGSARFLIERRDDGRVLITLAGGAADGSPRLEASAELASVGGESALRLLRERSESFDERGTSLGLLRIDHTRGEASCTAPGAKDSQALRIDLPADERVVNVPLNLLFLPLARQEVDEIEFQYFLCGGGPQVMEFRALRGAETHNGDRSVEVRYGPDLGPVLSWMASRLMPRLSFWFDMQQDGAYLGNRMPLFTKGPEVLFVREGVTLNELLGGR